jgi:glycerol-3-phosphate dehydrogenase
MYDYIAGSRRAVPESHYISRDEALYQFPTLNPDGLKGAIVLYDGQQVSLSFSMQASCFPFIAV